MRLKEESGEEIRKACYRLQREIMRVSRVKIRLDLRENVKFGEKMGQGLE